MTRYPGCDWENVYTAAKTYAEGSKDLVWWDYFKIFPNNNALCFILF